MGCRRGYAKRKHSGDDDDQNESIYTPVFVFPSNPELKCRWIKFVNRVDWEETKNRGICILHFEEQYLKRGKRITLVDNPIPTIITNKEIISKPSLLPTSTTLRKAPTTRPFTHPLLDQTPMFTEVDKINSIEQLYETSAPEGFTFQKMNNNVTYIRIFFEGTTPNIESIYVDANLHVKLNYKGRPIPLPEWFGKSACKLTSIGMLVNFVSYMHNIVEEIPNKILSELHQLIYYKPQGRPQYSNEVLRFSLLQRYTSRQAYTLLLDEFPLPSFSYLKALSKGGVEPMKALKSMLNNGKVDPDCVLLIDEMYLQKGVQYQGGSLVGADENGELYTGIVVFMVVSLKKSVPFAIKACPESKISGDWLSLQIEETLRTIFNAAFNVWAVITDIHAVNVLSFKNLRNKYGEKNNSLSFNFDGHKVYNLYDSVHLVKNIRNNLLNSKRFIFPSFNFNEFEDDIHIDAGEISWRLYHNVYEKDEILPGNLRKAPNISEPECVFCM